MEWINIKDKQPTVRGWYIVCTVYNSVYPLYWGENINEYKYDWFDNESCDLRWGVKISHWMLLPEPPKGE